MMEIWQRIRLKTFPVSNCLQSAGVDVKIMLEKNKLKYFFETDQRVCEALCSVGRGCSLVIHGSDFRCNLCL